jgi:hypothetical protein
MMPDNRARPKVFHPTSTIKAENCLNNPGSSPPLADKSTPQSVSIE